MTALGDWWRERSRREQWLLAVMLGLLAVVLGWLLVVRPLADAHLSARERYDSAVTALAEARARAEVAGRTTERPNVALPVADLVRRTAAQVGFADAIIVQRRPAAAEVTIAAARPQAVFGWIAQLEAQGLSVASLSARPNQDRTIAVQTVFRAAQR